MNCPHCGAEIAEHVVICSSCGARLGPEDESESPAVGSDVAGGESAAGVPAAEAGQTVKERPKRAEPPADQEYPPPWRYSLKDMRIVWTNMLVLTIALGAVAAIVHGKFELEGGGAAALWGVLLGIPAICWIYQLSKAIYRTTIKYDLDGSRLVHKEGIFVSKTNVIELIRIDDMSASQSLVERFLCGGIGKVHVHSDDPSNPDLTLRGLENHESVFRQIDERRADARRKKAFIQA